LLLSTLSGCDDAQCIDVTGRMISSRKPMPGMMTALPFLQYCVEHVSLSHILSFQHTDAMIRFTVYSFAVGEIRKSILQTEGRLSGPLP
jgi:hypothetical protein